VVEQEVISGALSDAALLAQAAEQLTAVDFCAPQHRLIAERLLPRASEEGFIAADIIAELPEEDGLQQLAVELRLTAKGYSEEEFAPLVAKLVEYRGARGMQVTRVVTPEADTLEGDAEDGEDFRSLERKIQAAINEGRLANDADYERYQRLARRFHGKGQHGFVDNQGETPLSPESSSRTQPPGNEKSPEEQPPAGS
jgi:hypothetical protein